MAVKKTADGGGREPSAGPGDAIAGAGDAAGPVRRRVAAGARAWWHLDRSHPGAAAWLAAHGVPDQAVEALLDGAVRPRLTRATGGMTDGTTGGATGGIVLILRAVAAPVARGVPGAPDGAGRERLASVRLWLDARGLVTLAAAPVPALDACGGAADASDAADDAAPGTLLADLIERVVDGVTPRIEALDAEMDALEDRVLAAAATGVPDGTADRLAALRRRLVPLSRALDAQRDALAGLSRLAEREGGLPGGLALDGAARLDLEESVEQCRHDAGEAEQLRERALILRDELERRADERTARHAFALSVAAAAFLPATFVTGLLGMNVGGLPGAEGAHAFWWVLALCLGVGAGSVGFVVWRRWL